MNTRFALKSALAALAVSCAVLVAPSSALALDATAFLERYTALAEKQGQTFTYDGVSESGGSIVVSNPAWKIPDVAPIKAETATFSNVSESDGEINIGELNVAMINSSGSGLSFAADNASMKDIRIPKEGETDLLKKTYYYSNFTLSPATLAYQGETVATTGTSTIDLSPYTNTPTTMSMNVPDIAFDLTKIPDPKFQGALQGLGYDGKFTGKIVLNGEWNAETGQMDIGTYDMSVDNVGTLSLPISFAGFTPEKFLEMQALNEKLQGMSEQERNLASMQMFMDLKFDSLTIKFTDDSITERALKMASQQMGQQPEDLKAGAPFMVSAAMSQLQMPELTKMVSTAIGNFLQSPGTLTVSADPAEPVTFQEIAVQGQTNPKGLVETLNVKVEAN